MLKSLMKKAGYFFAACIIFAAVVVCIVRLLTPILDNHRADIEKIASDFLQTPVTISNVRVSWYRYQPVIRLNNVNIVNKETNEPVFNIKKVSLLISIVKSLWQWQVVTNGIMASGAELNVTQSEKGEYTVEEFSSLPFNQQPKGERKFTEVMAWLSNEPYLILSNIDIYYTGVGKQKRFITLNNLAFENSESEHRISGKAILHQDIPTVVSINSAWKGKVSDLPNINADAYLYVSGLSLPQWAKGMTLKDWQVKDGILTAKIWVTWQAGLFQKIQGTFQSYSLEFYSNTNKTTHHINRLSGNIGWKKEGDVQVFAGDEILVDLPKHLWPVSNFSISLSPDTQGNLIPQQINIGYLDIADVQPFLFATPNLLPDSFKEMLTAMKPSGALQNMVMSSRMLSNEGSPSSGDPSLESTRDNSIPLKITRDSTPQKNTQNDSISLKNISFATHFTKLKFSPWKKFPGVANISGNIKWNGTEGEVKLASKNAVFKYAAIFSQPIPLDQLSGDLKIGKKNDGWLLNINSLQMLNSDLTANIAGTITLPQNGSPLTDINANFAIRQAKNITKYLPAGAFDKELNEWLNNAFLSGEITSAHAVLQGSMADFPFDNGKGQFIVSAKVNNLDFRFAPDWPILNRVKASLAFTGRKLTVDLESTETLGITIKNVKGVIPYLGDAKPQILEITTDKIETDFAHGMKYVHKSSLEKNIGKMFKNVNLQGDINLTLGLVIPLADPSEAKVKGDLVIKDSTMSMPAWNLNLTNLNGQLVFTENSTDANNIQAVLFNKPIQFDLVTQQKSKTSSIIQAKFTSDFDAKDIQTWLKLPDSTLVQGGAKISGVIDLSMKDPIAIHLRTDLVGTAIDFTPPYGKKASETRDVSADISLQDDKPMRIKMNYGKLFGTAVILERNNDKYKLIGANLRLGEGEADWPPTAGIYISGQLDSLDWDKIKQLSNQSENHNSENSMISMDQLKGIDIQINNANLAGQTLTQLNLQVKPVEDNWNIRVNSPEISGQLTIPQHMTRQSLISAQFQKINLHMSSDNSKSQMQIDVKSLPTIAVVANDVRFNDLPIGRIQFNASPSASGLTIQSLRISSSNIDLRATGAWKQGDKGQVTFLQGYANSAKVSRLLSSFGVDVRNVVTSDGRLNFNLAWPDAPYSPSIANMNGRASLALGAGRIVDIGADSGTKMGIGKMLSIFSLQTIPRRLSLDFSDVFQKGYSFDSLRGDFVIQNGELKTNNMRFDGPVAKVGINGTIGVKNKTYNFILSVTAHVTSSIPVAATLLTGNPLIGLGAFAVNAVIGNQVSGATTVYYAVTGPWNNPTWREMKAGRR